MEQPRSEWAPAAAYARSFGRLCAGTVEPVLSGLPIDDGGRARLLDVGAGAGTLLRAALDRGWDALGVDPEPAMLTEAARRVPADRLRLAGLPALPFRDAAFEAVTANFVVNHLDDPRAGVRELARILAPGGRLVVTLWPATVSPMNDLWNRVLARARVRRVEGMRLREDLDFERSPEGTSTLLAGAGLRVLRAERTRWVCTIAPDDLWWGVRAGIGIIGRTYLGGTGAERVAMDEAFAALAPALCVDGALRLPSEAVLAAGARPAAGA